MATSRIQSYQTKIEQITPSDLVSGSIKLIRNGKIRIMVFDDAKAGSSGIITIPTLLSRDCPVTLTSANLKHESGTATFWFRANGTFGWSGFSGNSTYNGEIVWIVA